MGVDVALVGGHEQLSLASPAMQGTEWRDWLRLLKPRVVSLVVYSPVRSGFFLPRVICIPCWRSPLSSASLSGLVRPVP